MSNHLKFAGFLMIIGVLAIVGYWGWNKKQVENAFSQTSDSAGIKDTIRIAVDSWVGYYPLCSAGLKRKLREFGYALECVDDNADYAARMTGLASGHYDFAVATVDSYILAGVENQYPGLIVAVIDESKGGDALIALNGNYDSLDSLKQGNPLIALTANSPSDYLAKSLAVHFDIQSLAKNKPWRKEVAGSSLAYKALEKGEVNLAVLWEPDVSRALASGKYHKVISTDQTRRLIVDVLLANRSLTQKNPEKIELFLQHYFRSLKNYRDNETVFAQELVDYTGLKNEEVSSMLKGVQWISLSENAEIWMAHTADVTSSEAVIGSIDSAIDVLQTYGDIKSNPLPETDPYRILNSEFIHRLYLKTDLVSATQSANQQDSMPALSIDQWGKLKEVGTLKLRPIVFASGSEMMSLEDKQVLDEIAENISHYPSFYVEVRGHSGLKGDMEENISLSQSRAEAVTKYLQLTHSIDGNRVRAIGFGPNKPLPRLPGEKDRAYNYRLPRVEVILLGSPL
jgi:outer membrane protein OmpA-like peptidoglycan-associated protein/ABC-type nitrate/sulfonate/bicarbonate transport system substrate-binding protein